MIRFKIDKSSTERLEDINELYRFSNKTVACRIAMAISLKEDKYLDVSTPTSSDGREYTPTSNLFGSIISSVDNGLIFKAILSKHYHKNLSNQEFSSLFKQHLMHGLEVWSNALESLDIANGDHIKYISDKISIGVSLSRKVLMSQATTSASKLDQFTEELVFELGEDLRGERVKVPINNLNYFDNRNIAIAGMAGSGKTQLVKDILYQIKENTGGKLKYIFFDYKGEGNPDQLRPFLEATDTHFIDILDDGGLEFNPLSSISADQRQQMFSIKAFADTVGTFIPNIGVAQKQILVTVLQDLFAQNKTNRPNINELFQRLSEYYTENRKQPDTLFSGIQDLTLNLFKSDSDSENIFKKSVYLNLPPSLSDTLRQLVVFLLLRYFNTYFSSTNDCIPEGGHFPSEICNCN
jgi:DNA sulfur modification protein DndE